MFKKFKIPHLSLIPVAVILFILFKIINNTDISYRGIIEAAYSCIAYFIWGFAFAYILNPPMKFFEKMIYSTRDSKTVRLAKRGGIIAFLYLLFFGMLTLFVVAVLPTIRRGVSELMSNIPYYASEFSTWITDFTSSKNPEISTNVTQYIKGLSEDLYEWLSGLLDIATIQSAVDVVKVPVLGFLRLCFGVVVSVYFLYSKEGLIRQFKRLLYAVFSEKNASRIIRASREINTVFLNYIISKLLQSLIMFVIGLIVLVPLKIKYAPLISFVIAIFNMIPYFGPYLGSIPCILLTLFYDPFKALWILIYSIGIQVVDNIIVGPKIMSSQVGVSPLLVILGVTLGGKFGGILGMFLGVPVIAVVKLVFYDKLISRRLAEKNITVE